MAETVLVVDANTSDRTAVASAIRSARYRVLEASTSAQADAILDVESIDFLVTELTLPDALGFHLVERVSKGWPRPGVIVTSSAPRPELMLTALRYGVADFVHKPASEQTVLDALERAVRRRDPLRSSFPRMNPALTGRDDDWRSRHAPEIIGNHATLSEVFEVLSCVADTDCPVLVTGESGTGKELVARALHRGSGRRDKAFIALNCAALPDTLIETELFGHAKGSFTGALGAKVGKFVAADGGTIFLDEVGELPLPMQAKLLRVLQEKEVTPVGENRATKVDVRIVAATNRNLENMVAEGTFREDLLYRLNVIPIELPRLRDRPSDIPDLVRSVIRRANARWGRHVTGITRDAIERMCHFGWPGNVRQLENVVQRMVVLRGRGELGVEHLPNAIREIEPAANVTDDRSEPTLPEGGLDLRLAVEEFENQLILQALERTRWNKNKAAGMLHMNRTTLVEKLKKKGIETPHDTAYD